MLIAMLSSYDMGCVVNKPEVFYNWFFIENVFPTPAMETEDHSLWYILDLNYNPIYTYQLHHLNV